MSAAVQPIDPAEAARYVCDLASQPEARMVCAANVHMLMEAHDDPGFAALLEEADLAVCDGRPLVWAARLLGDPDPRHCRGLDLMFAACARAEACGLTIGLYGAAPDVNDKVRARISKRFPALRIAYSWSPPFREISEAEDLEVVKAIRDAKPDLLFVSLGCPRQERWMFAHRDSIPFVMLGVGAAFDMLADRLAVAPRWMQRAGLEWAFRLASEPRRLWRRYAKHNARFVALVLLQRLSLGHGR